MLYLLLLHIDIHSLFFDHTLSYGIGAPIDLISSQNASASLHVFTGASLIFFIFLGSKNKEKDQKVKFCTNELKEIKDMANDVIQAVKSCKKSNTEDPGSMKLVLKELQLALGTFLSSTTPAS